MNNHNKKDNLNVRVTPETKKQLLELCKRLDRSQGWVISKLINKELERASKNADETEVAE